VRQVLSWRFIAAVAAILILLVVVNAAFNRKGAIAEIVGPAQPAERTPTLISLVLQAEGPGFGMTNTGQASTDLVLTLPPDERKVRIFAGTPGEISCPDLTAFGQCAVLAELLGDTVTWFAIVPMAPSFRFELPPIVELDGGLAHLANGWAVPYAPVIDRTRCDADVESFGEFLRVVGQAHYSLFDLGAGEIVAVAC
jgi:hypothetical protein